MNHNDYLFSISDKGCEFLRHFEDMYRNCEDPHGQSKELQRIDYQIVTAILERAVSTTNNGVGVRMLDVGCGLGYFTGHIQRLFPEAEVSGCDISATAVEKAKAHAPQCAFFTCDLKVRTSLPDRTYHVLTALHVLCYFTDDEIHDVLRNLLKLTTPGGFVLVGHHLPKQMSFARFMKNLAEARTLFEASGFGMRLELDIDNRLDVTYSGDPVGRNIFLLAQRPAIA